MPLDLIIKLEGKGTSDIFQSDTKIPIWVKAKATYNKIKISLFRIAFFSSSCFEFYVVLCFIFLNCCLKLEGVGPVDNRPSTD